MPLSSNKYLIVYFEPGVIFERGIERFAFSANQLIENGLMGEKSFSKMLFFRILINFTSNFTG